MDKLLDIIYGNTSNWEQDNREACRVNFYGTS